MQILFHILVKYLTIQIIIDYVFYKQELFFYVFFFYILDIFYLGKCAGSIFTASPCQWVISDISQCVGQASPGPVSLITGCLISSIYYFHIDCCRLAGYSNRANQLNKGFNQGNKNLCRKFGKNCTTHPRTTCNTWSFISHIYL